MYHTYAAQAGIPGRIDEQERPDMGEALEQFGLLQEAWSHHVRRGSHKVHLVWEGPTFPEYDESKAA